MEAPGICGAPAFARIEDHCGGEALTGLAHGVALTRGMGPEAVVLAALSTDPCTVGVTLALDTDELRASGAGEEHLNADV
jgi:hypothetical protein